MKSKKIILGSRGSKLALIYAEKAKERILKVSKEFEIESVEIKKITTSGDLNQKDRLSEIGGKGLFSKQIENELLENNIHIAIHALKDMPSDETEGLSTNCFLERNDPRETLISKNKIKFKDLNQNSIIGTSSFRREFQLKNKRTDLNYKLIRGNVDTRIKKLSENLYDAIILSYAGINFLNLNEHISEIFSTDEIIPSAGQGVIALQCKSDDEYIKNVLKKINDEKTFKSAQAERNVLKVLEGDCETAVGAISLINNENMTLEAELFSLDGKERFYCKSSKDIKHAAELGIEIGENLKKQSKGSYKK
jgi:hydroxymethylbilane synthase|tara:strand:+ start:1101 stop:2024 length:924 start_codon:yes stop_codon:yes gene_type:complete